MKINHSSSNSRSSNDGGVYKHYVKLVTYMILWYLFTVAYNITNKAVLNELNLPVTVATCQICIGVLVFAPIWFFGTRPSIEPQVWYARYHRVAWMHGLGNVASVCAFATGAVSFVHVVKAAEPLFTAFFAYKMLAGFTITKNMLASLAMIIVGVSMSSLAEATFNWSTFLWAFASNALYQLRIVLAKKEITQGPATGTLPGTVGTTTSSSDKELAGSGQDMHAEESSPVSPATLFRIITLLASVQLIPLAALTEGWKIRSTWQAAVTSDISANNLLYNLILSGVFYYLYNEIAFWVLDLVTPVTHAIGNSLKRVVVIFVSMILLNTEANAQAVLGGLLAVSGAFLYALASRK